MWRYGNVPIATTNAARTNATTAGVIRTNASKEGNSIICHTLGQGTNANGNTQTNHIRLHLQGSSNKSSTSTLPIPKKTSLPLPPPIKPTQKMKPPSSGNLAGLSLGSLSKASGATGTTGRTPFKKPPPVEVSTATTTTTTPRFHTPGQHTI